MKPEETCLDNMNLGGGTSDSNQESNGRNIRWTSTHQSLLVTIYNHMV